MAYNPTIELIDFEMLLKEWEKPASPIIWPAPKKRKRSSEVCQGCQVCKKPKLELDEEPKPTLSMPVTESLVANEKDTVKLDEKVPSASLPTLPSLEDEPKPMPSMPVTESFVSNEKDTVKSEEKVPSASLPTLPSLEEEPKPTSSMPDTQVNQVVSKVLPKDQIVLARVNTRTKVGTGIRNPDKIRGFKSNKPVSQEKPQPNFESLTMMDLPMLGMDASVVVHKQDAGFRKPKNVNAGLPRLDMDSTDLQKSTNIKQDASLRKPKNETKPTRKVMDLLDVDAMGAEIEKLISNPSPVKNIKKEQVSGVAASFRINRKQDAGLRKPKNGNKPTTKVVDMLDVDAMGAEIEKLISNPSPVENRTKEQISSVGSSSRTKMNANIKQDANLKKPTKKVVDLLDVNAMGAEIEKLISDPSPVNTGPKNPSKMDLPKLDMDSTNIKQGAGSRKPKNGNVAELKDKPKSVSSMPMKKNEGTMLPKDQMFLGRVSSRTKVCSGVRNPDKIQSLKPNKPISQPSKSNFEGVKMDLPNLGMNGTDGSVEAQKSSNIKQDASLKKPKSVTEPTRKVAELKDKPKPVKKDEMFLGRVSSRTKVCSGVRNPDKIQSLKPIKPISQAGLKMDLPNLDVNLTPGSVGAQKSSNIKQEVTLRKPNNVSEPTRKVVEVKDKPKPVKKDDSTVLPKDQMFLGRVNSRTKVCSGVRNPDKIQGLKSYKPISHEISKPNIGGLKMDLPILDMNSTGASLSEPKNVNESSRSKVKTGSKSNQQTYLKENTKLNLPIIDVGYGKQLAMPLL